MRLSVTANVTPARDGIDDVELVLTLDHDGCEPVVVYLDSAGWARSGWMGPLIAIEGMREIRSWLGPPGQPPIASYFEQSARALAPGKRIARRFAACLFAQGALEPRHLAPATLDPEGMDGLAGIDLTRNALLVVGSTSEELLRDKNGREDFLRPGLLVPLAPVGPWELRASYAQASNGFYQPKTALRLTCEAALVGGTTSESPP